MNLLADNRWPTNSYIAKLGYQGRRHDSQNPYHVIPDLNRLLNNVLKRHNIMIYLLFLHAIVRMKEMMDKSESPIYERNTLEFVTVALEYCSFIEAVRQFALVEFVDKATKLLPLLYLKATLLPEVFSDDEIALEYAVTEDVYESVRERIAGLLGERDTYLETFHPDMQYSDTPIAAFISENLADVYQDTGNFVSLFRQGNEDVMLNAIALCRINFKEYWGQRLLNALKALHAIRYNEDEDIETNQTG